MQTLDEEELFNSDELAQYEKALEEEEERLRQRRQVFLSGRVSQFVSATA